jgi:putative heme-binding domain-containing protein
MVGGSAIIDQLTALSQQRVIAEADRPSVPLVDIHDHSFNLDDRARSYLHANCGMCHHQGGTAIASFYLSRDLPFKQLNTNKGTNIGTFGITDAKIIVPGDPYRSLLLYRMSKLGYARMPYIGSQVVDSQGIALMDEWIRSLRRDSLVEPSPLPAKESTLGPAIATLDSTTDDRLARRDAIGKLIGSTEGSLALTARLHAGRLLPADREDAIAATRNAGSDIRGLFETFVPESERKKTLGRDFDPSIVLALRGDISRGQLIFSSDQSRCRNCHHVHDASQSVGPTLAEINTKYAQLSELLRHAINPSEKIDEKYAAWSIVLNNGRVIQGLLDRQSDAQIDLRTADKQIIQVPRADIDTLQKSARSLMPDGILADLTAQEAADLLAFVRSTSSGVGTSSPNRSE